MSNGVRDDRPAADHVYSWIRNAIAGGRFISGEQYSIHQLAEDIGISRTPVREAVLRLADIGLVRIERHRGFVIEPLTVEKVRSTYEARMLIEIPAAEAAARSHSRSLTDSLERHLARMDGYLAEANIEAYREWDRSFHAEIVDAVGNARITSLAAMLRDSSVQMWGVLTIGRSNFRERSWKHHADIAKAIAEGDAEAAGAAMRAHLETAALTFMKHAARMSGEPMPERFSGNLQAV